MKRTKLASSVPLPPGSMPPSSAWYQVPRCFACDDPIKSHRFSTSLLLGKTHYSHSSIPGKLGEYIGDGFVVVVTSEDALCRNCMNLLNTMDRLEEELKDHRTKLVGNLRRKYGLDPVENKGAVKLDRKKQTHVEEDDDVIEIQSDEEWTPHNKKRKVTPAHSVRSKTMSCNVCKTEFIDLSRFMTHLKQHREQKDRALAPNEIKVEKFKCGCCTLSFDKKEALAVHMRLHTAEKLNRPSVDSTVSLLKNNFNNGSKLYPTPTSQTVVEMKLIMDADSKMKVPKGSPPLEKPVTVTKVTEQDSGGKVCLLALWNSGSCSDHADCQDPSCASASNALQAPMEDASQFIPRIVVKQSQDSVPEIVVSQSEVGAQSEYQISSVVQQSQAGTSFAAANSQLPVSTNSINPSLSCITVSVPSTTTSATFNSRQQTNEESSDNKELILKQNLNLDKTGCNSNAEVSNTNSFQSETQVSNENVDAILNSVISKKNILSEAKSMPSLDDDIIQPVTTERTIVEHDEMGNIAIVNVTSVDGSEGVYDSKDGETDWFYANEQTNAVMEAPHSLWGNQDSCIDQVDGMTALPAEVKEQNDSVDENETSDYFTSRYVVDTEKMRQEAEALADAILAAIKS